MIDGWMKTRWRSDGKFFNIEGSIANFTNATETFHFKCKIFQFIESYFHFQEKKGFRLKMFFENLKEV